MARSARTPWFVIMTASVKRAAGRFVRALPDIGRRIYALALAGVVALLGYKALHYLVEGILISHPPPQQVTGVPLRMDEALLHSAQTNWPGLAAVENPRTPLTHYHRFETWVPPDRFNDCTRSGCHSPLPHARKKEERAFLNMHATSLHCGVCHMSGVDDPRALVWYDLDDGRPRMRPALLDAYDWLQQRAAKKATDYGTNEQREISRLLSTAAEEGQREPHLQKLARDIAAVRAGSDAMAQLVDRAREAVRRALRGSYGSKLALRDEPGNPTLGHPGTETAVREWLTRGSQSSGEDRERLLKAVHPRRRETALDCTACHRAQGSLIDFAAAGYPPARVRSLTQPLIFEMIQHIREGRPFVIPTVGISESRPAPPP